MKTLLTLVMLLTELAIYSQGTNIIDTVALKEKVLKEYEDLKSSSAQLEEYYEVLGPLEELYPLLGNKNQASLMLSSVYFNMARKFNVEEKKTIIAKQLNFAYVRPEKRREYLLKAKKYLEVTHVPNTRRKEGNYNQDDGFKSIENELKKVDKEIKQ